MLYEQARELVLERDEFECQECGSPGTDPHHILGRVGNYRTDPKYIILLCHECHLAAHNNLMESRARHLMYLQNTYGYKYPKSVRWRFEGIDK